MPEKIRFFPLDITYKIAENKAAIHLFGRTAEGKQICAIDENFEPYFYVIPKKGKNVQEKLEKIKIEREGQASAVTRTEITSKRYFGEEVEAIKVYTQLPKDVPVIKEIVKDWEIIRSTNEYDVQFTKRYLIDKGISPLTLVEAEGDFISQKSRVPVFKLTGIKQFSDDTIEKPRILAFDIETYNPQGKEIAPSKNPIIMVSFYGDGFEKVFTWKRFKTSLKYIEFVKSEAELIEKFKSTIDDYKPDMLAGYFSDEFDLPYIKARADKYKIRLDIGLDYSELKVKRGKSAVSSSISGIIHLDIFKFVIKIMGGSFDKEAYSLDNVSKELINEKKEEVDLDQLAVVWDQKPEHLEKFCSYNLHDSLLAFKLSEKILPSIIEMVKIVGLTVYDATRMGFSQLVESYLLKQAPSFNEIAPNKPDHDEIKRRRMQTYKGAFVYEPKPGLYRDIVVFDYRSLYPTIISSHNIDPAMRNCTCCEGKAKLAPIENKNERYWFCTKRKGFIPTMIEDLIKRRMRIKEIIKEKQPSALLDARQNSLKLLANSFYGYLGFFAARWYSIECAKAVTAYGRYYIHKVIDTAKKAGFNVIYSDTDSVFMTLDKKTKKDIEKFAESVNMDLPELMELEFEGLYPAGIFVSAKVTETGAKKKYALLTEEGALKIRGFETVRRNWSFIAKEVQEQVLNIVLKENKPEKALDYVKQVVKELKNKKIPLEKVIIHTQLQKETQDYAAIGPHVAIAKKLKEKGIEVGPGFMIRYVVTKGEKKIRDKAKLPEEVKQEDYDADYYIENQVIPSVEKIFAVLGYKKEDLFEKRGQKQLGKFF